jgi:hypothetical protein
VGDFGKRNEVSHRPRVIFSWIHFCMAYNRVSTIIAHIPWLFTYLRLIPDVLRRKRTRQLAEGYMNQRVAEGSNIKDLMYYLVSMIMLLWSPIVLMLTSIIDRRRRIGTSETIHASCILRR